MRTNVHTSALRVRTFAAWAVPCVLGCGVLASLAACQQEIRRSDRSFRSPLATGNASKVTTAGGSGSSQQKKPLSKVPGQAPK